MQAPAQAPASDHGGNETNGNGSRPPGAPTELPDQVSAVLQSEIGVATLLNRLKQSIATAKVGDPDGLLDHRCALAIL
jgi:Rho GTPase-activating protein RGD1